ncbi:MAG: DUF4258 domain-containing protein [Bacteroidota bacterium]|nr:DUF4258 domain-containing protein [Bacteroidota bacterium]
MRRRNVTVPLFLLLVVFLVFLIRRWNEPKRKEAFDRDPPSLRYSTYALCQMQCRRIRKEEVKEIMKKGVINFNRSNRRGNPCPTFTLQGRTMQGKSMLVFFEQCPKETKVITCYNPREAVSCECSGDENKGGQ